MRECKMKFVAWGEGRDWVCFIGKLLVKFFSFATAQLKCFSRRGKRKACFFIESQSYDVMCKTGCVYSR